MMRRRRPLARAALIGGGAYVAGKHSANRAANEQDQNEQIAELQEQQEQAAAPAPAAPAPAAVGGEDMVTQLQNLKKLLDEGVLTQAEFDMQKQKVLASS
jgi:hypothetical protein